MTAVRPLAGARRRSVTAAPFRNHNDQIVPDDYRQHKRAMHKAGVRASSSDNPGAVRHLRKQSLADVVVMENRAKAGEESARPKPPCIGLADVLLVLVYTRQLPANVRGLRIPWMSQAAGRRVAGWCAHPCTSPHCPQCTAPSATSTPGGSADACGGWSSATAVATSGTSVPSVMVTARRSAESRRCRHGFRRRARRLPALTSSDCSNL